MRKKIFIFAAILCVLCLSIACQIGNNLATTPSLLPSEAVPTQTTQPTETSSQTVQPSKTTVPRPTQTPPLVVPFNDDFSSARYGWPTNFEIGEYSDTNYEIIDGVYRWTVNSHKNSYTTAWSDLEPVSNFTVIVDARLVSGKAAETDYGLIYRRVDGEGYISFAIRNSKFSVYLYSKTDGWKKLVAWTYNKAIQPGEVNRLKVVLKDGTYTIYVNDTQLTQLKDLSISEGKVGLGVNLYQPDDTAIFEFDNFTVTSP